MRSACQTDAGTDSSLAQLNSHSGSLTTTEVDAAPLGATRVATTGIVTMPPETTVQAQAVQPI